MSSPAERYAAARRRTAPPPLPDFTAELGFSLDPFQVEACEALDGGSGVLVCAPTGAGKTVVGEFAVHKALAQGRKAFYTTPIKALSNQKYADLVDRYGEDRVGLLTGDNAVNGDAPVVVMTTEVLRNMLYAESPAIDGLGYVIIDERTGALPDEDLHVLGFWEWREGLLAGLAAHHAGLVPAFKETVEECFVRGLVKAVFATETLALGINMPARTVVLERLVKWNGEAHVDVTPGGYTQLTWPARPPGTRRTPSGGPPRCTPTPATSPGTRRSAGRSPSGRRRCPATRRP